MTKLEQMQDKADMDKELAEAKEIRLAVHACGSCSVGWRLESSFMQYFTDDTDVKANVSYHFNYDDYKKNGFCMKHLGDYPLKLETKPE